MLSIRGMCYLPTEARKALAQMVAQIFKAKPPLTHLSLSYFSKCEDPAHGMLMLDALNRSGIASLTFLRVDGNMGWWTLPGNQDILSDI